MGNSTEASQQKEHVAAASSHESGQPLSVVKPADPVVSDKSTDSETEYSVDPTDPSLSNEDLFTYMPDTISFASMKTNILSSSSQIYKEKSYSAKRWYYTTLMDKHRKTHSYCPWMEQLDECEIQLKQQLHKNEILQQENAALRQKLAQLQAISPAEPSLKPLNVNSASGLSSEQFQTVALSLVLESDQRNRSRSASSHGIESSGRSF